MNFLIYSRKREKSYHLLGIVKVIIIDSFLIPTLQLLMVCFQLGSRKDGEERTVEVSHHWSDSEQVMSCQAGLGRIVFGQEKVHKNRI